MLNRIKSLFITLDLVESRKILVRVGGDELVTGGCQELTASFKCIDSTRDIRVTNVQREHMLIRRRLLLHIRVN